jgi:glycosyltransferase involved in cell wall biosynthesis
MCLVENPGNRGKGYSVRNGVLHAQGAIILFSDADLSSPIEEAPKLIEALDAGADVSIGSRWMRSELQTQRQSVTRQVMGRAFNVLLRLLLALNFKDTNAASKAPAVRRASDFSQQSITHGALIRDLVPRCRMGFKTTEIPVVGSR